MTTHLLTLIIAVPLIGGLLVLFVPNRDEQGARTIQRIGLAVSLVTFALTLLLWSRFDGASAEFQFVELAPWIPAFGIDYHVGVDGISLWLVVLTGFLTPISLLSSWESIEKKTKEFTFFVLALEAFMLGVFVALDLFLFYVFWDAMLIPMYFLIGVWGYDRRIYAAIKFMLYTMAGSVLMLVAILGLAYLHSEATGSYSFDYARLLSMQIAPTTQYWFFLAFAVAFAIKVPLFPFHTWLPDAHVEAPTAGSVILAGVLLKMGTYGLVRFAFPLFPSAAITFAPWIAVLAVIGIVYGALVAMVQPDMKKLVAYSSVSHMGFVMLGMFALNPNGLNGSILQQINHGVSTGALFLIVGIIYERRHTREIAQFGGLSTVMPVYATIFLIMTMSSIGLPLLNGFIGEFTIMMGALQVSLWWAVFGGAGIVLGAAYMLWLYQRTMFGKNENPANQNLLDLNARELATLIPLIIVAFWIGLYPAPFFNVLDKPVNKLVETIHPGYFKANAPQAARVVGETR